MKKSMKVSLSLREESFTTCIEGLVHTVIERAVDRIYCNGRQLEYIKEMSVAVGYHNYVGL